MFLWNSVKFSHAALGLVPEIFDPVVREQTDIQCSSPASEAAFVHLDLAAEHGSALCFQFFGNDLSQAMK